MAALELHINLCKCVFHLILVGAQPVVHGDYPDQKHDQHHRHQCEISHLKHPP